jgi:uncharacterized lipoprotein YmbA
MMRHSIPIAIVFGFLTGCATNVPQTVKYYQFDIPQANHNVVFVGNDKPVVLFNPVSMSAIANNASISQKLGSGETHLSNYHQWASPPKKLLSDYLLAKLSQAQNGYYVSDSDKWPQSSIANWQVDTNIDSLQGYNSGKTILSGVVYLYQLVENKKTIHGQFRFAFEEPMTQAGFTALVESHQNNVDKLVDLINKSINEAIAFQSPIKNTP